MKTCTQLMTITPEGLVPNVSMNDLALNKNNSPAPVSFHQLIVTCACDYSALATYFFYT